MNKILKQSRHIRNLYKNKSFIGELLSPAPTVIDSIEKGNMISSSEYILIEMGKYSFTKNDYESKPKHLSTRIELKVNYDIIYDSSFYETIKPMHNGIMVELEGQILNFTRKQGDKIIVNKNITTAVVYHIQLKLSGIKEIEKVNLYSDLLNDEHHFYSNLKKPVFNFYHSFRKSKYIVK